METGWFGPTDGDCRCDCACDPDRTDLALEVSGIPAEFTVWYEDDDPDITIIYEVIVTGMDGLNGTYYRKRTALLGSFPDPHIAVTVRQKRYTNPDGCPVTPGSDDTHDGEAFIDAFGFEYNNGEIRMTARVNIQGDGSFGFLLDLSKSAVIGDECVEVTWKSEPISRSGVQWILLPNGPSDDDGLCDPNIEPMIFDLRYFPVTIAS